MNAGTGIVTTWSGVQSVYNVTGLNERNGLPNFEN